MSITVVLNGFKRPHTLKEQYAALKEQTVQDFEIMLWVNLTDKLILFTYFAPVMLNTNICRYLRYSLTYIY